MCSAGSSASRRSAMQLERQRLQGVAHQQRGRLVVFDVHRGLAAAQDVVVHAGHVVVHQRIGMDHFHRRGDDFQARRIGAGEFARGKGEQRTHALAALERGIAHGLVQARRRVLRARQAALRGLLRRAPGWRPSRRRNRLQSRSPPSDAASERLEHLALQYLHLLLCGFQALAALLREFQAALVRGERLLERQPAVFHLRDEAFELRQRLLEAGLGGSLFFLAHGGCHHNRGRLVGQTPNHVKSRAFKHLRYARLPCPISPRWRRSGRRTASCRVLVFRPGDIRAREETAVRCRRQLRRARADGARGRRLPDPRVDGPCQAAGAQRVGQMRRRGTALQRLPPSPVHHAGRQRQHREHRLPAAPLDL